MPIEWDEVLGTFGADIMAPTPIAIGIALLVAAALIGFGLVFKFLSKGGAKK